MSNKIAVIVAHPDDEVLGAGATIARHIQEGDKVYVLFMTNGVGARGDNKGAPERHKAALAAADAMQLKHELITFLDLPDNQLDTLSLLEIIRPIEKFLFEIEPEKVFTHHAGDLNIDHRLTHQAVMTACRPLPGSPIKRILGMEVPSSTEWAISPEHQCFVPNHFVQVHSFMEHKLKALQAYDIEMRDYPHPRSYEAIEALAKLRGAQAGLNHAEAFTILRDIQQ